jgi:hypothetical protein
MVYGPQDYNLSNICYESMQAYNISISSIITNQNARWI